MSSTGSTWALSAELAGFWTKYPSTAPSGKYRSSSSSSSPDSIPRRAIAPILIETTD